MKVKAPLESFSIERLLNWADRKFKYVAYFTDQNIDYPHGGFINQFFAGDEKHNLSDDKIKKPDLVGIISYDLKNSIENLTSNNPSIIEHPDAIFFRPVLKISFTVTGWEIDHPQANEIYKELCKENINQRGLAISKITHLTSKEEYIQQVKQIKTHIVEGDIYEMNYCIAFEAEIQSIDYVDLFSRLIQESPMPFSSFFKAEQQYLLCASPERFLKKEKEAFIAQPIKGTSKRGINAKEDNYYKSFLLNSEKERSENLMIVDLMRNDLSKISITGSVEVEELFGIYSFQNVHQMISTIRSKVNEDLEFKKIIANTFPMGSMTGAPKIKCMQLIDKYENFKRGWFSGSVGYIDQNGDFDFNVIIRSVFIDGQKKKLFFAVGSAITYDAVPEMEYKECLLKAKSIFKILKGNKEKVSKTK